jgi:hypothetical protein
MHEGDWGMQYALELHNTTQAESYREFKSVISEDNPGSFKLVNRLHLFNMQPVIKTIRACVPFVILIFILSTTFKTAHAQSILDRELAAAAATVALGGQLTNGVAIAFTTAANQVPGTLNTGTVTFGFKTVTEVPIGGKVTIALPNKYFSAVDPTKANTLTGGATAKCVLTVGTSTVTVLGIAGADTVVCTTETAVLAAATAITFTFIANTVTTGSPQAAATFNVANSVDRELAAAAATLPLGDQLTNGVAIAFTTAANQVPGTLNTGTVTFGFKTVTEVPIGGKVTIALPHKYFSAVDPTKANTLTGGATAKCVLTVGTSTVTVLGIAGADTVVCTTETAVLAAATAITFTFIANTVTTGLPQAAATFNVATSVDRELAAAAATLPLGDQLTNGVAIAFTTAANQVPGTLNTGTVTFGFKTVTEVPIGGKVTIALPNKYFSAVDPTKANTLTGGATAKCVLTVGTSTVTVLGIAGADTVVCTTETAVLAAATAITFTFIANTVTAGAPQAAATFNVATSVDRELAAAAATLPLGDQLTNGVAIAFTTAANQVPGTLNTGTVTFGFKTVTEVPIGGKVTIALPNKYFSAVDPTKANTLTGGATAKCVLTVGTSTVTVLGIAGADTVVCTTETAVLAAATAITFTFIANTVTAGAPQAAATFNVATSVDRELAAGLATLAIGGQLSAGVAIAFTTAANQVPGTLNTGTVTFGFSTVNAVPIGGKVTIALPNKYFSAVDPTKANTLTGGATAKCVLTVGTSTVTVLGIAGADTVVCTTETAVLAAATAITFTFIANSVTTGNSQAIATFNVATSVDRQLFSPVNTVELGGQLTSGVAIAFTTAANQVPGTRNTGSVTLGFKTATVVPVGGAIVLNVPRNYFSAVNTTAVNLLTSGVTATCVLTVGTTTDKVVCTTSTAVLPAGATTLTFTSGAVTTGLPQAASTFNAYTTSAVPATASRALYLPKASSSSYGVAWMCFVLAALVFWL